MKKNIIIVLIYLLVCVTIGLTGCGNEFAIAMAMYVISEMPKQ